MRLISRGPEIIRVACVDLDRAAGLASQLAPLLTEDERQLAARAHRPLHQSRRLAARAALRLILARAVGESPGRLRFSAGPHGKPALCGFDNLHFSLSHSEGLAAIAHTAVAPVGIDIEHITRASDEAIDGALSDVERAALAELQPSARDRAFTRMWVRKEALLKAVGVGLSVDPRSLTVLAPAASGSFDLRLPEQFSPVAEWSLTDLTVCEDVAGALACQAAEPPPHELEHVDILRLIKDFGP